MSIRRSLVLMIMLVLTATLLAGDDANNPHDLKTLAAKQAWISLQRDLEKLDAQYQRDRQARIRKAIVDLETAKVMAAQAANADEIVQINEAVNGLKKDAPIEPLPQREQVVRVLSGSVWSFRKNQQIKFNADGTITESSKGVQWTWYPMGDHRVVVQYPSGWIDLFVFDPQWRTYSIMLVGKPNEDPTGLGETRIQPK